MNKKVLGVLLASVVAMGSMGVSVYAADAEEDRNYSEYTPAKDEYNLVFIPKVVHTWYEGVKTGIDEAVAELEEKGVKVNYVWDACNRPDCKNGSKCSYTARWNVCSNH